MSLLRAIKFFVVFLAFAICADAATIITDITSTESSLTITTNTQLINSDYKVGSVEGTPYKKYYDIKAVLSIKPNSLKTTFSEIKYAQFNKDITRVVFACPKETVFQTKIDGNKLIISWQSDQKTPTQKLLEVSQKEPAKEQKHTDDANDSDEKLPIVALKSKNYNKNKLVILDPGHGGKDSGAVGIGGRKEKDSVLAISKYTKEALVAKGYKVIMTRSDDVFIELKDRTAFANNKNADVFVSIHANAVDGRKTNVANHHGIETYFLSPARSERAKRVSELENGVDMDEMDAHKDIFLNFLNRGKIIESNKLAIDAQKAMLANLRSKYPSTVDGGVREAPFWVLVGAQMPAILVEVGYITHPNEGVMLLDPMYQMILAKSIADGVDSYFTNNQ